MLEDLKYLLMEYRYISLKDLILLNINCLNLQMESKVFGNLKSVEKPKPNNIEIFVKRVSVDSKEFDYKVEGWVNCDALDLETSRDGIYEGNERFI